MTEAYSDDIWETFILRVYAAVFRSRHCLVSGVVWHILQMMGIPTELNHIHTPMPLHHASTPTHTLTFAISTIFHEEVLGKVFLVIY